MLGCIHTYQGTGTHHHQMSWSALCPMCCRCCWHGCVLRKVKKCRKVQNVLQSCKGFSRMKAFGVLPSLAWTSMTMVTDKVRKHNHTHLHLIVAAVGSLSPKHIRVRLFSEALYIQIAQFFYSHPLSEWGIIFYCKTLQTCRMDADAFRGPYN